MLCGNSFLFIPRKLDRTYGTFTCIFVVPHYLWILTVSTACQWYGLLWDSVDRREWSHKWIGRCANHNDTRMVSIPFICILFGSLWFLKKWNKKSCSTCAHPHRWESFSRCSAAEHTAPGVQSFRWNGKNRCYQRGDLCSLLQYTQLCSYRHSVKSSWRYQYPHMISLKHTICSLKKLPRIENFPSELILPYQWSSQVPYEAEKNWIP